MILDSFKNIPKDKLLFIIVNILVSFFGFIRSFVYMKFLGFHDLGVLTMLQTIIQFISLLQFGFINGGYRMFALGVAGDNKKVNNLVFSFFGVISIALLVVWGVLVILNISFDSLSSKYLLLSVFVGLFSLVTNWLTNTLIGSQKIKELNIINLISSLLALICLPLVNIWGLTGAIVVLFIQPFVFTTLALLRNRNLRPNSINFDLKLTKIILSWGFIPFLSGIFVILNMQIERWSIIGYLGVEELGRFYLVFLYATLFVLIPTSLLSLFFPQSIKLYEGEDIFSFKKTIKKHTSILIVYLLVITLFTLFFLDYFIAIFFPLHIENVIYVKLFLPGLIALVLCDPISLILNSSLRLKPILWVGLGGLALNLLLILICNYIGVFELRMMSIIKSSVNISILTMYLLYIMKNYKVIFINQKTNEKDSAKYTRSGTMEMDES